MMKQVLLATLMTAASSFQTVAGSDNAAGVSYGDWPGSGGIPASLTTVHPLKLGATALGLVSRVDAPSFSIPADNADESGNSWTAVQLNYNFMRPLGEMEGSARQDYSQ
jgi:hypothetical protein